MLLGVSFENVKTPEVSGFPSLLCAVVPDVTC